jgi:PhzF family phenazine biosynthesis protein
VVLESVLVEVSESEKLLRYYVVDAFAERPFTGNPAAVVPLEDWPPDYFLQALAMEMNLSETAYFVPGPTGFHLRWFTPKVEVDLCGHATLAAAEVILHLGLVPTEDVTFQTRSGPLVARRRGDMLEVDLPIKPEEPADSPEGLSEALGFTPMYVGRSAFDYLVLAPSEEVVRALKPDFPRLAGVDCRGVIVTAASGAPYDFVSRFFAPKAGIDEDPVTGSAHCCLADFWRKRLGKREFLAYQASSRGGMVKVEIVGDRVLLGGRAIRVAEGVLNVR